MRIDAISHEDIKCVLEAVDHKGLLELTRDLVKINSVWDPAAGTSEQEVAENIAVWAQSQGFEVQIDQVTPERPNIRRREHCAAIPR